MIDYSVHMTDAVGDGWNDNVFGIRQNNTIVTTFGSGFIDGSSYGPINISVMRNVHATLVLVSIGSSTE